MVLGMVRECVCCVKLLGLWHFVSAALNSVVPKTWMPPSDAESRVSKTSILDLAGHSGSWHRGPVALPPDTLDVHDVLGFLIYLGAWLSRINGVGW